MPRTKKRLAKHLTALGLFASAAAAAACFPACNSDGGDRCVSNQEYFAEQVWAPILATKCIACHNPTGLAKASKFVLESSSEAGFLDTNMQIFASVAAFEKDGTSLVLLKPSAQIDHGGGPQIEKDGAEYKAIEEMVQRFKEPAPCQPDASAFFADVEISGAKGTLRKAALALAGRLPTAEEEKLIDAQGDKALDAALGGMMREETFYLRLKEIYNDLFLTDRYLRGGDALDLLESDKYDPKWYENLSDPALIQKYGAAGLTGQDGVQGGGSDLIDKLRHLTNQAVAQEPLELVAHVVRENRPFTEIVAANYFMVNPYSANAWGLSLKWKNDADPHEWQEASLPDMPHSGVLTSPMFLNRHPTTDTNRNRHRARMVYLYFLGTDILKTAERPIDPTKISDFNPTMNNPSCTVCHAQIDPIAGTFHSFDERGNYDPTDKWLDDMRPPGFGADTVPYDEFPRSLQWLGYQIGKDGRFALSTVYTMYTGFTGQKPLLAPPDPKASDFQTKFKAYLAQYYEFSGIAKEFIASHYDLRTVVKAIVKSPYFRAKNAIGLSSERQAELEELGMAHLLIPEQLNRKIKAITGYPWTYGWSGDLLTAEGQYRILYGGINSDDVTTRVTAPNGVMANIADRMANEMACWTAARDFQLPQEQRLLFPKVDPTFEPKDANGFDVVPAVKAIKENIQYLHKRILGEDLALDDPEIQRTYDLFFQTWDEGKKTIAAAPQDQQWDATHLRWECGANSDFYTGVEYPDDEKLNDDPNFTIRAWQSVVAYLLADYSFLYE